MAYKVIILYRLYMPSYVLGTFTEYPCTARNPKCEECGLNGICKESLKAKIK